MANLVPRAANLLSTLALVSAILAYARAFGDQPHIFWGMLCALAGTFLSVLIHEAAHAGAALARGWRVIQFVVGPIGLQLPNRNLAFMLPAFGRPEWGWVSTVPSGPETDTKRSWAIITAAGPAASFAFGLLAFAGWTGFLRPFDTSAVRVSAIGLGLALQALQFSLFNILPDGEEGQNDGDCLRELYRRDYDYRADKPVLWIDTLLTAKVRPSALPAWLLAELRAMPSPTLDDARYLAMLEIGILLDSSPVDVRRVRRLLDSYRALYGTDEWHAAYDALHAAVWEGAAGRAEAALRELPDSPEPYGLTLAAQAAIAADTGDAALARRRLKELRREVRRGSPFRDLAYRDIARRIEATIG